MPLFRIRRGWRTGSLVPLVQSRGMSEACSDSPATAPRARVWNGNHRIDLRASIPLPTGRWYVTIVAGPERRSAERLRSEGQMHWLRQSAIYVMLMSLALWLMVCAVALIYLLKIALDIDLFEGNSPLHFLWEWLSE